MNKSFAILGLLFILSCTNSNQVLEYQIENNLQRIESLSNNLERWIINLGMPLVGVELNENRVELMNLFSKQGAVSNDKIKSNLIEVFNRNPIPNFEYDFAELETLEIGTKSESELKLVYTNAAIDYLIQSQTKFIELYGMYDAAVVRVEKRQTGKDTNLLIFLQTTISTLNPIIEIKGKGGTFLPIDTDNIGVGTTILQNATNDTEISIRITSLMLNGGELVREKTIKLGDL